MYFTLLSQQQEIVLNKILSKYSNIEIIIAQIVQQGGKPYLVGGTVRDLCMNTAEKNMVKDLDIEVHGLSIEKLAAVLGQFGIVHKVGKSFGVLRIGSLNVDWSLPRVDLTAGRHPEVKIDENLSLQKACMRRDLTMNAMLIDLQKKEIIDFFDGRKDIKNKTLKTPDKELFKEDPLRFFRVAQYVSRFNMLPDKELEQLCTEMTLEGIAVERIQEEFKKMLLLSTKPSQGIRWIGCINRLSEILPELHAIIGIKQDTQWHPEGDVFEHSMQALDVAASITIEDNEKKLQLLLAALCHDLGKVNTTEEKLDKITSYNHEITGVPIAKNLLKKFSSKKSMISPVLTLIRYHMMPSQLIRNNSTPAAYKRLAVKLAPHTNMKMLSILHYADKAGRAPIGTEYEEKLIESYDSFVERAKNVGVFYAPEKAIVKGKDLLSWCSSGPIFKKILEKSYQLQIEKKIKDKDQILKLIKKSFKLSG